MRERFYELHRFCLQLYFLNLPTDFFQSQLVADGYQTATASKKCLIFLDDTEDNPLNT